MKRLGRMVVVAVALCGCVAVDRGAGSAGAITQALGEPTGDRPGWVERVAFYASNRARMDPAATGWPSYPAAPPLLWHDQLAQSARAHSEDMRDHNCFQHPSCDGTDPFVRIKGYFHGAFTGLSENIAAGVTDGQTMVTNWIDEIGAAPGTTGHRDNLFDKSIHLMYVGLGYAGGGNARYNGYWTQDFAAVAPAPQIPSVPAGAHWPESVPAGGSVSFGAIYYAGAPPTRVEVVIDGKATPLALFRGPAAAGAYEGTVAIGAGCHRYYFRGLAGASGSTYPSDGTLGVASDDARAGCAPYLAGGITDPPSDAGAPADAAAKHDLASRAGDGGAGGGDGGTDQLSGGSYGGGCAVTRFGRAPGNHRAIPVGSVP